MAKFVILLVCLGAFEAAYGLKCYSCESNKNSYCNDVPNLEKISLVECGKPAVASANIKPSCLKVATEDTITKLVNVTRKCVLSFPDTNACDVPIPGLKWIPNLTVTHCSACEEEGCNSATFLSGGVFTTIVGFFITKYIFN